jgi:formamidase
MKTVPEIRIVRDVSSVAVDLKISQLVDVPKMLVSAFLPEDIFTDS